MAARRNVEEFVAAVRRVAAGGTAMDAEVISQLLGRRSAPIARLTAREREALELDDNRRVRAVLAYLQAVA